MLFCPRLRFLKGISKVICDIVLYIFLEGTKSLFTQNSEVPVQVPLLFISIYLYHYKYISKYLADEIDINF